MESACPDCGTDLTAFLKDHASDQRRSAVNARWSKKKGGKSKEPPIIAPTRLLDGEHDDAGCHKVEGTSQRCQAGGCPCGCHRKRK